MFRKAQPVICLLLTTMLLFSLTACSEKHSNEEKPAETAVQRVTSPPSTTTAGETEGQPNTPVETTTKPETERETGRETSKETTKETTEETKKETAEVTSKEAREETTGETTTEPPKETEKAKEEVKPAEPVNISGSLAVNPGFEEVTEEGLEGWTIYLDGPGRGEIGVDTEKKIEGSQSLRLSVDPGAGETLQLFQGDIPVEALTDYDINFYYCFEGLDQSSNLKAVDIYWYDSAKHRLDRHNSEELFTRIVLDSNAKDWKQINIREKSPANAAVAVIYIHLVKGDRGTGGHLWIDAFVLKKSDEQTPSQVEEDKPKEEEKAEVAVDIGDSLVFNAGFEMDLDGWKINLSGPGRGEIKAATDKSKEGKASMKLFVDPGAGETLQVFQADIPLEPLTDYDISLYYCFEGMDQSNNLKCIDIYWYDQNGTRLNRHNTEELFTRILLNAGAKDWTKVGIREKSPENAVKASMYIHLVKGDRGTGGSLWVDAISFTKASEGSKPPEPPKEAPKEVITSLTTEIKELGIASNTAEARSGAIVRGSDGKFYAVLPSIGFLVCYDFENETSTQHFFENNESGAPFKSFASQAGKFYTGANKYFYEFDPVQKEFTAVIEMSQWGASQVGWGFCEDDNGIIYFANYPKLYLYSFDPKTKQITSHGIIDDTQMYSQSQAADSYGWVYCAIGTAEANVVGINIATGEKKYMFPRIPATGSATVYKSTDGRVVAQMNVTGAYPAGLDTSYLGSWYVLENGEVKEKSGPPRHSYNTGYPWTLHIPYDNAPSIGNMDYPAKTFDYWDPVTKKRKTGVFTYNSKGADCSPITLGPDGIIYGTTNHPMNIFTINPKTDEIVDHGIKSIGSSVGNICCYAYQNDILVGAAYSGGYIFRIDTKLGIVNSPSNVSPRTEATVEAIHRPRSALALSDNDTCLFAGYGGYGVVGGGMVLYNVKAGRVRVIENHRLLKHHSILGMAELPNGNVLCGTSVLNPGGGIPVYDTAALFEFNPETFEVTNITYPFKGVQEIAHLVWAKDAVHGITSTGVYFVYDYQTQQVTYQQNLRTYGTVVRQGMEYKHNSIYLLLSHAILKIDPSDYTATRIAELKDPATSGMAVTDEGVYYCSGPKVYKAEFK
jgi:hypothetical protein